MLIIYRNTYEIALSIAIGVGSVKGESLPIQDEPEKLEQLVYDFDTR
ncbi:unnamed protein product [marine sediment metagenome]|uniref:Uncharacterized protein n=1 Tax=marine sediment metagenome TaxID=412755 RepID=X1M4T1_9ZZZZ